MSAGASCSGQSHHPDGRHPERHLSELPCRGFHWGLNAARPVASPHGHRKALTRRHLGPSTHGANLTTYGIRRTVFDVRYVVYGTSFPYNAERAADVGGSERRRDPSNEGEHRWFNNSRVAPRVRMAPSARAARACRGRTGTFVPPSGSTGASGSKFAQRRKVGAGVCPSSLRGRSSGPWTRVAKRSSHRRRRRRASSAPGSRATSPWAASGPT